MAKEDGTDRFISKTCVVIGFEYGDENGALPGTLADIFRINRVVSRMRPDRLSIITDIKDVDFTSVVSFTTQTRSTDILEFMDDYQQHITHYEDRRSLMYHLSTTVLGVDFLFIYYTGHMDGDSFRLPNRSSVPLCELISMIDQNTQDCEVVLILDCCCNDEVGLGTVCQNGRFIESNCLLDGLSSKILLISPGMSWRPTSTPVGSSFTEKISSALLSNDSIVTLSRQLSPLIEMKEMVEIPSWVRSSRKRSLWVDPSSWIIHEHPS